MKQWITAGFLCLLITKIAYADSDASIARQKLFTNIEENSEVLEDLVDDKKWQKAAPLADEIADDIEKLSNLFPDLTDDEGRARDAVWAEWPEFSDSLQRFENDFRAVSTTITAGEYEKAENKLDDATSSCRSCHMSYRSLW